MHWHWHWLALLVTCANAQSLTPQRTPNVALVGGIVGGMIVFIFGAAVAIFYRSQHRQWQIRRGSSWMIDKADSEHGMAVSETHIRQGSQRNTPSGNSRHSDGHSQSVLNSQTSMATAETGYSTPQGSQECSIEDTSRHQRLFSETRKGKEPLNASFLSPQVFDPVEIPPRPQPPARHGHQSLRDTSPLSTEVSVPMLKDRSTDSNHSDVKGTLPTHRAS